MDKEPVEFPDIIFILVAAEGGSLELIRDAKGDAASEKVIHVHTESQGDTRETVGIMMGDDHISCGFVVDGFYVAARRVDDGH